MKKKNAENEKAKSRREENIQDTYKTKIELTVEQILNLPRTKSLRWFLIARRFYKKRGVDLSKIDLNTMTQRIVQDWGEKEETARLLAKVLIASATP